MSERIPSQTSAVTVGRGGCCYGSWSVTYRPEAPNVEQPPEFLQHHEQSAQKDPGICAHYMGPRSSLSVRNFPCDPRFPSVVCPACSVVSQNPVCAVPTNMGCEASFYLSFIVTWLLLCCSELGAALGSLLWFLGVLVENYLWGAGVEFQRCGSFDVPWCASHVTRFTF